MTRPLIGDFRGTEKNKPRIEAPPPPEPEQVEPEVPAAAEALEGLASGADFLSPAEIYQENLKKLKIDLKTAELIYDTVLTKGYYEEYVRLRGNHRAVFRTRSYEDHLRLQTVLEMQKPQLALSQDELITRYNLAASLYEWDGKALKHGTDDDFDAIMAILRKMPAPLFSVLARELSKFDAKIMAVFAEGADENF